MGSVINLNAGEDLSHPLSKIENAGGKISFAKNLNRAKGFYGSFQRYKG